uniref:EOG090X0464 n=1 Tax=Simocephalus serrulatus TaxID=117539 RepID=A0A4Y7NPX1_9CRUS|nr:EOG090X0464 [Simocephalus serrulatus]SVE94165.1 EOG090X0464 [Simocephalus serrulatus]
MVKLLDSCKKKQLESNTRLPGHTVLVGDSSDEELAFDSFKDDIVNDKEDEVVDDSLVEYSLIRKWLQNAEDSFDSEEDRTPESECKNFSSDSGKSYPQEKNMSVVQPKPYSAVRDDTIILSSSDEEKSPQKLVHHRRLNIRKPPLSPSSPPISDMQSMKPGPKLSDSFDSFDSHLNTASLKERLAMPDQPVVRRNILDSSSDSVAVSKPRPTKKGHAAILCLSSEEETLPSPQTSPTWKIKPMTKINLPSTSTAVPESESELEDIFVSLTINDVVPSVKPKRIYKPRQNRKAPPQVPVFAQPDSKTPRSFLASLSSEVPMECRHIDAVPYIKNFRKYRDELTARLFVLFNEKVFKNNLPRDFSITWNSRLTRTAGYCRHFTKRDKGITSFESRVELSVKVVDTPCRLRDTLIHELCHAATWVIDNCRGGHGPVWRNWANQALHVFPELPPISRCHNYEITFKFYYNCVSCRFSTGRHSKSVDTSTHVCPMCRGQLQLSKEPKSSVEAVAESTPKAPKARTPNAFALFVKENYASIKSSRTDLPHAAVMKLLSAKFAESKKQML